MPNNLLQTKILLLQDICVCQYFTLLLHCYFGKVNMKNIGKIKDYLLNSFGWKVEFEDFDKLRGKLPYSLLEAAEYTVLRYRDFKGVAIEPKSEDDFRLTRNLVNTVERKTGMRVLLILESLAPYQRRVLIDNNINFIVPNKQIYLPAVGVLINERGLGVYKAVTDKLTGVSTAIITLQLSKGTLQGKSISQAAVIMGYSVKTISLAVSQLEDNGLVSLRQEGRKKILDFLLPPAELWYKAYALSESPVEKRMFTANKEMASKIGIKASDSALSEISMLAEPQQEVYAVYGRNPQLNALELNPSDGSTIIEIWKTDPVLSSTNGIADIFSLALSYKDDDDPRVRKELDKLLNENL